MVFDAECNAIATNLEDNTAQDAMQIGTLIEANTGNIKPK